MGSYLIWIPLLISFVLIVVRVLSGRLDKERIKKHIGSRGGQLIEARWDPFGPGWYGESINRIYLTRYIDRDGNQHKVHCKTSLWSGVYFAEHPDGYCADDSRREGRLLEGGDR